MPEESITIRRLSPKSLFRILLYGVSTAFIPFATLCGVLAMFGMGTVTVNNQPMHGVAGLIASIIMGPIFSLVFSFVVWIWVIIGLWLFFKFSSITITFNRSENSDSGSQRMDA